MVRFAAFAALLAVLVTASFVWADDRPSGSPTADAAGVVKGSITTRGIRDGTIRPRDLSRPLRRLVRKPRPTGKEGEDGEDGFDGADGFDGLDGLDGQDGVSGREVATKVSDPADATEITAQADCPGTKDVVGGGAIPPSPDPSVEFEVSMTAQLDDNTWQATVRRVGGSGPWSLTVQAICVTALP
jgi:hypothetical protein